MKCWMQTNYFHDRLREQKNKENHISLNVLD